MQDGIGLPPKKLTNEREIKQLEQNFVLVQGDTDQEQLVNSWLSFFETCLIAGERSDIAGRIGISPNRPINSIPFDNYKSGKRVVTENKERSNSVHQNDDALFPTDVFSILSGIAALLVAKNYGVRELAGYQRDPRDSFWLKKWATKDGEISELYLLQHSHEILNLVRLIRSILPDFYSKGARPPAGYISPQVLIINVAVDVAPAVYDKLPSKILQPKETTEHIISFLSTDASATLFLLNFFSNQPTLLELSHIHDKSGKMLVVVTTEGDVFFIDPFIDQDWYAAKKDSLVTQIVQQFKDAFLQHVIKISLPNIDEPKPDTAQDPAPSQIRDSGTDGPDTSPTVREAQAPVNQADLTTNPFNSRTLNVSQLGKESAVVASYFLYQQFVSQGIPYDEAERLFGSEIRSELQIILSGYTDNQIAQLFLSRSSGSTAGSLLGRKRLYEDLFSRLSSRADLLQRAGELYGKYGLSVEIQSFAFQESLTSNQIFKQQLAEFFNIADLASGDAQTIPVNATNRIDTILLSYGLNDFLPENERVNHKDAIWFIENLDTNKLALIFFPKLSPEQSRLLVQGNEEKLKTILIGYAKTRGAELILHTYSADTARGFLNGVSKEDQKATQANLNAFHKHFNFSSHPLGDLADQVSQNGGEKAAGTFVASAKSKQQQKLEELNKIFLPEWTALGADGQKRVYELFNLPPRKSSVDGLDYLFLYEFITLDREQIRLLREPRQEEAEGVKEYTTVFSISDEQRKIAREIAEFLQLERQEHLEAREWVKAYLPILNQEVISAALAQVGPEANYDDLSPQLLYQADADMYNRVTNDEEISGAISGQRGPRTRRFRRADGIEGKFRSQLAGSAKKRLSKVLKRKTVEDLAGLAANPWLNAALWLTKQENRPLIGGALFALGAGIYNAFTNGAAAGGAIGGGLAGAGIGFAAGGPVGALIGGIIGAVGGSLGAAALFPKVAPTGGIAATGPSVLPYSVQTGLGAGAAPWTAPTTNAGATAAAAQNAALPAAQQAATTAATTAAATAPAATAGTAVVQTAFAKLFTAMGTATLAPIIFLFITVGATMYTLTLIQSAFLVSAPFDSSFTAPAQAQFFKCTQASITKPTSANVHRSADGKYAFPMDMSFAGGMSCPHYDGDWVVDIFTLPYGTPVEQEAHLPILAYTDATVHMVVTNDSLGGLYLILKGDDGRWYYYAHNCAIFVTQGQRVAAGEIISVSDRTGLNASVTPEHLHFGIQDGGTQPDFTGGGNVCPHVDFNEKFTDPKVTTSCNLAPDCATRL